MESLRVSVHLVLKQIPGLLLSDGPMLSLMEDLRVDLHQFLVQVRNCDEPDSCSRNGTCLAFLRNADLLPGWYDDWVVSEEHRLRNLRLRSFLVHGRRWLDQGEADKALEAAEGALELEPLQESCVELLMCAELQMGNRVQALRRFETFKTRLILELGVAPSKCLVELAASIR